MSTLNKVMLIGNLGDEVKMHHFEGGGCIGRFPIATSESYTNKQTNERVENTEWHNIVVSNKLAEICDKYLAKGRKVYVEGKLVTRKWQDQQGNDRYSTEVRANDVIFLSPQSESSQPQPAQSSSSSSRPSASQSSSQPHEPAPIGDEDDDLPF